LGGEGWGGGGGATPPKSDSASASASASNEDEDNDEPATHTRFLDRLAREKSARESLQAQHAGLREQKGHCQALLLRRLEFVRDFPRKIRALKAAMQSLGMPTQLGRSVALAAEAEREASHGVTSAVELELDAGFAGGASHGGANGSTTSPKILPGPLYSSYVQLVGAQAASRVWGVGIAVEVLDAAPRLPGLGLVPGDASIGGAGRKRGRAELGTGGGPSSSLGYKRHKRGAKPDLRSEATAGAGAGAMAMEDDEDQDKHEEEESAVVETEMLSMVQMLQCNAPGLRVTVSMLPMGTSAESNSSASGIDAASCSVQFVMRYHPFSGLVTAEETALQCGAPAFEPADDLSSPW